VIDEGNFALRLSSGYSESTSRCRFALNLNRATTHSPGGSAQKRPLTRGSVPSRTSPDFASLIRVTPAPLSSGFHPPLAAFRAHEEEPWQHVNPQ
jgi:hypothetical protein